MLITLVLLKVDLASVKRELGQANVALVVCALLLRPVQLLVGAVRWWALLRQSGEASLGLGAAVRHYWIGMALGLFVPAQVTWDVYRAAVVRRTAGRWGGGLAVLSAEKLLGLATVALLVLSLSGVVLPGLVRDAPALDRSIHAAQGILVVIAAVLLIGSVGLRSRRAAAFARRMQDGLMSVARRLVRKAEGEQPGEREGSFSPAFAALLRPAAILTAVGLTILLHAVGAAGTQVGFRALGYSIPYVVNLFITPVITVVMLLPVSLGGIGVREAAFIILYGPFGVPPEAALAVSVLSFTGMLLSGAIGSALMFGRDRADEPARSGQRHSGRGESSRVPGAEAIREASSRRTRQRR
jgi:uncharacterized protein (TIRG00374 family)